MKDYYKHLTQLEVYEMMDRIIATTDEATFNTQLRLILESRKERGFTFNDHKRSVLPPRKAWRAICKEIRNLRKGEDE
jgi:hypothetical protein